MNNLLNKFKRINLVLLLSVIAALVSYLPLILAAPALRAARVVSKSALEFWLSQILFVAVLWLSGLQPLAISLFSAVLLIGVYSDVFNFKKNLFIAGFASILSSSLFTFISLHFWFLSQGLSLKTKIEEQVQVVIKQSQAMNSMIQLDSNVLMSQAPSALVCLLIVALALSLILERSIIKSLKYSEEVKLESLNLRDFKLPDFMIWVSLFALLFSFLKFSGQATNIIAMNILNVMVVLYFFQGLAVCESFFIALRFGFLLRVVTYLILLMQLFFVVSAIGFSDFWVGFRSRFLKKKTI